MKLKNILNKTLVLFVLGILLIPIINVKADDAVNIGDTSASIKGINYRIDEEHKIIYLSSNASVELMGNALDYRIVAEKNAKNVHITLNNYTADTQVGGWKNTIELQNGSSVRLTLVGENNLTAGQESSAIRVPKNTSLVIDGNGVLNATVHNGGSGASSAVIGSQYSYPFGDIIINGGNIHTAYSGGGNTTGIGSGDINGYKELEEEIGGTITLNGGNIYTDVLGSATFNDEDKDKVFLQGNGNATVYTDRLDANANDFNGIIFDEDGKTGTVKGNATLNHDMTLSPDTVLTVEDGASLTIPENVTLTNNGNIVNNGNITNNGTLQNNETIDNKGTINNNGTLQNTEGSIDNTSGNITSTTDIENVDGNEVQIISYNVTVNVGDGGSVNPGKSFEVEHGQTKTFDILPDKGYKIKSVIVNGEDRTNEVIDGKLTLENITKDITINVEFEKLPEVEEVIPVNNDNIDNPKTYDDILFYILFELISIIGLTLVSSNINRVEKTFQNNS